MSQKWKVIGLIAFFLGFPLAGMLFVWSDAHGKIRWRAVEYVQPFANAAFAHWDGKGLADAWNARVKETAPDSATWAKWKEAYGEAKGPIEIEPYNSYTSEREDAMWQVVKMRLHVPGSKKEAIVDLTMARMTMVPRWHFEHVEVRDAK